MSDSLASLAKKLDQSMRQAGPYTAGRGLGTYIIVNDRPGQADRLRDLARKESLQHVTFGIGSAPPSYAVHGDAEVTVLIYNPARRGQQSVVANFALRSGELNGAAIDAIATALAKALPKPAP